MRNYCWWVRGPYHAALAATSIASVRKVDPQSRLMVAVDAADATPAVSLPDCTIRNNMNLSDLPPMLANLEAIWRILSTLSYGEELVVLDADTIVLRPVHLLNQASLAVTWRDHTRKDETGEKQAGVATAMPYNFGVMALRADRHGIETVLWMRERVRQLCARWRQWYGNQIALVDLLGAAPTEGDDQITVRLPWSLTEPGNPVTVNRWHGETWNYTPGGLFETLEGRAVLHFKGHSRAWMEQYAKGQGLPWVDDEHDKERAA